jgi:hypothetical protein
VIVREAQVAFAKQLVEVKLSWPSGPKERPFWPGGVISVLASARIPWQSRSPQNRAFPVGLSPIPAAEHSERRAASPDAARIEGFGWRAMGRRAIPMSLSATLRSQSALCHVYLLKVARRANDVGFELPRLQVSGSIRQGNGPGN